jgi:hypothetical protein
VGWCADRALVH